jgi:hypothetical protein
MPPPFLGNFNLDQLELASRPCRPRILIVTDGTLGYNANAAFGLTRFIEGITLGAGVTVKPILTLAHRGFTNVTNVPIGPDVYTVKTNFDFATATPAVTIANYDQIWLFGIESAGDLPVPQVTIVAEFMNSGGGVFATGDHATLGRQMSGRLPRIRHMREWAAMPMGLEAVPAALARIDTVVDPNTNGIYDFLDDQGDNIPQRIYPHYKVTGPGFGTWQATVHPLLMRPGAPATRSNSSGFTLDVDCLPDHQHESVCKAVEDAATLGGSYTVVSPAFEEFRPAVTGGGRTGAEIVASAVSGGRSVSNGGWKPPVTPRMFGIVSAYDGRLAQPYAGKTERPGRAVCDSTWHHFVNLNLDGTGSTRTGLGTGSGAAFAPSPALLKIHDYYRNIVSWLQPANRIRCRLFWDLIAVRFDPVMIEELVPPPPFDRWPPLVQLGQEAIRRSESGDGLRDMIAGALLDPKGRSLGDSLQDGAFGTAGIDETELIAGIVGGLLLKLAELYPTENLEKAQKGLRDGPKQLDTLLRTEPQRLVKLALDHQLARADQVKRLSETLKAVL